MGSRRGYVWGPKVKLRDTDSPLSPKKKEGERRKYRESRNQWRKLKPQVGDRV